MTFWTDERVLELRAHFAAGLTGTQIMTIMGAVSRNAIIGKLSRLGLHRDLGWVARKARAPRTASRKVSGSRSAPMPEDAPVPSPAPPAPIAVPDPCPLLELDNWRCRYPISPEDEPYVFCGAREADLWRGVPYCRKHSRIAYDRRGDRKPNPDRGFSLAPLVPVAEPSRSE
jgi:GcrA cell cycle regulator